MRVYLLFLFCSRLLHLRKKEIRIERKRERKTNTTSLPILVQPDFIRQALQAGKHVLSEKPIAKDVATARDLLRWCDSHIDSDRTLWAVAENFRYQGKYVRAAEEVRKRGGVKTFRVCARSMITTESKYYRMSLTFHYLRFHVAEYSSRSGHKS